MKLNAYHLNQGGRVSATHLQYDTICSNIGKCEFDYDCWQTDSKINNIV